MVTPIRCRRRAEYAVRTERALGPPTDAYKSCPSTLPILIPISPPLLPHPALFSSQACRINIANQLNGTKVAYNPNVKLGSMNSVFVIQEGLLSLGELG